MLLFGQAEQAARGSADRARDRTARRLLSAMRHRASARRLQVVAQIVLAERKAAVRQARSAARARLRSRTNLVRSASCRATMRSRARLSAIAIERVLPGAVRPGCDRLAAALQLRQEPQPLLRERQGQRFRTRSQARWPALRCGRRPSRASANAASTGSAKQLAQRHLHAERGARARSASPPAASGRPARRSCRAGRLARRRAAPAQMRASAVSISPRGAS